MGKLKPFLELEGHMLGVELPEGERHILSDFERKEIFHDFDRPDGSYRYMIVYRHFTNDPVIFLTNKKENATPIITIKHSPRCPYCDSPKCLHRRVGETELHYFWTDKQVWGGTANKQLIVCKCKNKSQYFINDKHRARKPSTARCQYCGSTHIDILSESMAQRSTGDRGVAPGSPHFLTPFYQYGAPIIIVPDPIDEDPADRIESVKAIRYVCVHCKYESTLWIITSLKETFVSYRASLISPRDNYFEAEFGQHEKGEETLWVLKVTPGWEIVE